MYAKDRIWRGRNGVLKLRTAADGLVAAEATHRSIKAVDRFLCELQNREMFRICWFGDWARIGSVYERRGEVERGSAMGRQDLDRHAAPTTYPWRSPERDGLCRPASMPVVSECSRTA